MLIPELVDRFVAYCQRHKSPTTAKFYKCRLRLFRAAYPQTELSQLKPLDVDEHLGRAGEGKSDSTKRHNAVALEQLQNWAVNQELLAAPVFKRLPKPPIGERNRIPTSAETAALLKAASPEFRLIYRALRLCGARPGELCRATIADYNIVEGVIVLTKHKTARKTGKPREIPIGGKVAKLVALAIGNRTEGPIFLSPAGKAWSPENLSRTYGRLRNHAGLAKDLVLYLARHECGTELTKRKGIKYAQDVLGHASIKTTQRYAHLDRQDLRDAQDLLDDCEPDPEPVAEVVQISDPPPPVADAACVGTEPQIIALSNSDKSPPQAKAA